MIYKVLVFGAASDITGGRSVEVKLDKKSVTIKDLRNTLLSMFPSLGSIKGLMFAVNNEYSYDDQKAIKSKDEIALIPPTSGG